MAANLKKLMGYDVARQTFLVGSPQEVVRDCVHKLYRNPGDEGLMQAKVPADRSENRGPIRTLMYMKQQAQLPNGMKKATPDNKAATFKVYNSNRLYGSSRSSMSSLHRRNERRRKTQTGENLPSFMTRMGFQKPSNTAGGSGKPAARNQHMKSRIGSSQQANAVTDKIRKDLLPVDSKTKCLISVCNTEANEMAEQIKSVNAMYGWNQTRSPQQFSSRQLEQNIAQAELEEQYRHLKNINQLRQYETMRYDPNLAHVKFGRNAGGSLVSHSLAAAYSKSVKEKHERILRLARENKEAKMSAIVAEASVEETAPDPPKTTAYKRSTKTVAITVKPKVKNYANKAAVFDKAASQIQKNFDTPTLALPSPTSIACSTIVEAPPTTISHFNRYSSPITGMKKS